MLDELVLVTQAVFVQHAVLIHHDGVIHAAAECQVLRTEELDVTHETEGARAADFLDERSTGKIHAGRLGAVAEHRVIEIDLEAHLETIERHEGGALVALLDRHFAKDTDELLVGILLLQPSGLNQEYKGTSTAVHDRYFGRGELDVGVIDAQASHGRKQVLYRIHLDVTIDQCGRHGGFTDIARPRGNFHDRVQVGTTEHDTGVHRCRLQGQVYLLPGMQADASGADNVLQGTLSDHGFGRYSTSCELFSTMAGDDSRTGLC
ncbi:hypothetical protein D3C84_671090 [compost metagenome]